MPNHRPAFVPGGCWFFTVNLSDRRRRLLTDYIEALRVGRYFSWMVRGFVGSPTWMMRYLTGLSGLGLRDTACNAPGGS